MRQRANGFTFFLALFCTGTMIVTQTAGALELLWSSGARDLAMTGSGVCTLLVRATQAAEPLPQTWQLSWVAAGGQLPLRIREVAPQPGIADLCSYSRGLAPVASASRTDTAIFCAAPGVRATVARYVIELEGRVVAKAKLVPLGSLQTGLASPDPAQLEVTVNGGAGLAYAPLPLVVRGAQVGDMWTVSVAGADLDRVRSVRFGAGQHAQSLEIVSQSAEGLTARLQFAQAPPGAYLQLIDDQGLVGTIEMPEGVTPEPWARDRFLVRFCAGEVEPEAGRTAGLAAQFQYRDHRLLDSLTAVGVIRLERLLPWFRHGDVSSINLLGEPVVLQDLADLYVAHVGAGADIRGTTRRVAGFDCVRYACPDYVLMPATPPPSDPLFSDQWWLQNTGQVPCGYPGIPNRDIDALHAWDLETGTANIRVGILDTGILAAHPDLAPRVVLDTSFVDDSGGSDDSGNRHGTAVAGIAGSSTDNGQGVAGVARGVTLWSIKVCDATRGCYYSTIIQGIDRARVKGLPIVNLSLGTIYYACPQGEPCVEALTPLNEVCLQAYLSGMFLVAASGNAEVHFDGTEALSPIWPAAFHRRVFAVGAFANNGQRWSDRNIAPLFCSNPVNAPLYCRCSNYSAGDPWLDVVAPGGRYVVTTRDTAVAGRYHTLAGCQPGDLASNTAFGGTSAAAPVVAGVAALLKSRSFDLTGDDLEQLIIRTTDAPLGGYDPPVGYGRVRAGAALEKVVLPYVVLRDSLRSSAQQLVVADSTVLYGRRFIEVLPQPFEDYTTSCVRYRMRGTWTFSSPFTAFPWVWIRGSGTMGWRDTTVFDQRYEVPGGRVVSVSADSAVFETHVYRIRDSQDTTITLGWYPGTPMQARLGCAAVGLRGVVSAGEPTEQWAPFSVEVRPNPMRREAWIDLSLPRAGTVDLEVFDLAGRRVATLVESPFAAGRHSVRWDGRGSRADVSPAGVYYVRCGFGGAEVVRRLILLGVNR